MSYVGVGLHFCVLVHLRVGFFFDCQIASLKEQLESSVKKLSETKEVFQDNERGEERPSRRHRAVA